MGGPEGGERSRGARWAWIAYFWSAAAFLFLRQEERLADDFTLFELAAVLVEIVAVAGLFGFVYRREVASAVFWRWLFRFYLALTVVDGTYAMAFELVGALELLLCAVFLAPMFYGIFRYSRPS